MISASLSAEPPNFIALDYLDAEIGKGIPEVEYEIHFEKGAVLTGTLNQDGKARHENVENKPVKKVVYKPRKPKKEKPHDPLQSLLG